MNLSNRELILIKKGLSDRIFENRILGYNTIAYEKLFERILIEQEVRKVRATLMDPVESEIDKF